MATHHRQGTTDRDNEARDERHITQDVEHCPNGVRGLEGVLEGVGAVVGYFQVASDEHICAVAQNSSDALYSPALGRLVR